MATIPARSARLFPSASSPICPFSMCFWARRPSGKLRARLGELSVRVVGEGEQGAAFGQSRVCCFCAGDHGTCARPLRVWPFVILRPSGGFELRRFLAGGRWPARQGAGYTRRLLCEAWAWAAGGTRRDSAGCYWRGRRTFEEREKLWAAAVAEIWRRPAEVANGQGFSIIIGKGA